MDFNVEVTNVGKVVGDISTVKVIDFDNTTNAFNYVFEKDLKVGEKVIAKLPRVSANKRGINDIGWICDGEVKIYGTLARDPKKPYALCQEIRDNDDINKVTSALIIVNEGPACRIEIRAIFN